MTIHIIQLPDSKSDLPEWLEQHFVAGSLAELAQELITVDGPGTASRQLKDLLTEDQVADVVQSGFSALNHQQIDSLLSHPQSLLTLQEQVVVTGSPYWDSKFAAGPLAKQAASLSNGVRQLITSSNEQSVSIAAEQKSPSRRNIGVLVAGFASAVAILVAVLNGGPSPSGRILGQPGLTADNTASAAEYFNRLADAGATWTQHKPANEEQLAKLLADIINDCEMLIEADHDALSADERTWFRDKCLLWKGKLETNLANLQSGSSTFQDTLKATGQVMDKLVDVLKSGPVT